jgi:hypothetical protein
MPARSLARRGGRTLAIVFALAGALAAPALAQQLAQRLLRYSAVVDGPSERPLRWPVAVAAGGADEIAVADARDNRLLILHRVGSGWPLRREVALPAPPAALAFVGGEYLLALRGAGSELLAVRGGESAAEPRKLALPDGIVAGRLAASSDGGLLVWDARRGRVAKLQGSSVVAQSSIAGNVTALASDGAGGFWAGIGERGALERFDAEGRPAGRLLVPSESPVPPWPAGIVADPGGRLFVLDRHQHRVVVLDGDGKLLGLGGGKGWEPGQLYFPDALARLPNGALLISDGGNGRAQLFDVIGSGS